METATQTLPENLTNGHTTENHKKLQPNWIAVVSLKPLNALEKTQVRLYEAPKKRELTQLLMKYETEIEEVLYLVKGKQVAFNMSRKIAF